MNKPEILTAFNNHITDFFNDVCRIFPDNSDLKIAQTSLSTFRKMNPKLIIGIWKEYIVDKYRIEIEEGDMRFFVERNYTSDLKGVGQAAKILEKIDTLREPIRQMGEDNLKKSCEYIQNLTKICDLYYKV